MVGRNKDPALASDAAGQLTADSISQCAQADATLEDTPPIRSNGHMVLHFPLQALPEKDHPILVTSFRRCPTKQPS